METLPRQVLDISDINELYKSKDYKDVLKFYSFFNTPQELMKQVRSMPRKKPRIYEIEGDKDIVIVVPTKDHNSDLARKIVKLFEGYQIILVESGVDRFFNFARNTNIGAEKALRYSPKWIIITNDDMYKIDEIGKLKERLMRLDNRKFDNIWINPEPDYHHCRYVSLVKIRPTLKIARRLQGNYNSKMQSILDSFDVTYLLVYNEPKLHYRPFVKTLRTFRVTEDFIIISGDFMRRLHKAHKKLHEEVLITGADSWLSANFKKERCTYIDFRIGSMVNTTYGVSRANDARSIIGMIIFDYMIKRARLV